MKGKVSQNYLHSFGLMIQKLFWQANIYISRVEKAK